MIKLRYHYTAGITMLHWCISRSGTRCLATGKTWDRRRSPLRRSGGDRHLLPFPCRRGNRSGSCCRRSVTSGLLFSPGGVSLGRDRRVRRDRRDRRDRRGHGPETWTGLGWSPPWTSSAGSSRCCCEAEGLESPGVRPRSSYTRSCHRAPDLTASR